MSHERVEGIVLEKGKFDVWKKVEPADGLAGGVTTQVGLTPPFDQDVLIFGDQLVHPGLQVVHAVGVLSAHGFREDLFALVAAHLVCEIENVGATLDHSVVTCNSLIKFCRYIFIVIIFIHVIFIFILIHVIRFNIINMLSWILMIDLFLVFRMECGVGLHLEDDVVLLPLEVESVLGEGIVDIAVDLELEVLQLGVDAVWAHRLLFYALV